jgi:hypothetical protein
MGRIRAKLSGERNAAVAEYAGALATAGGR